MKFQTNPSCNPCSSIAKLEEQHHYFISHLSHEVRNPLTLVSSSLQLLEKECPSVKQSILWPQIQEDIHTTISLLQDISSFNNSGNRNLSTFPAKDFFSSLSVSFASYMKQRNIVFSIRLAPSVNILSLTADRRRLQEAITNLLINAADALCDSRSQLSHPLTITLTAECFDKNLQIHIRDNGPGISDDYLPTLFDPFVTHKATGTGLGLAIVQNVARMHGGSVSVETSCLPPDSYTDFCFCIPSGSGEIT